ncbi:DoxX family membrane protein [Nesterenkonia massiliensis]|uniref:DoxX family membrane protein n=1 Tax=Nesterenkonia massiliensis TaxID=1232429 RepID=A0ABT2HSQ2_9MICC|nr:DoxX family membrane protein [Nesterenkonia massiliensis]MCT1607719.1 DoxX family membrane protein [Nesterenkonia massiliensis]
MATSDVRPVRIPEPAWYLLALVRILIGLEFLWAFLDKTFGLTFSTAAEDAWINGGSPTYGYLSAERALQEVFQPLAGVWIVDVLFMLGLLGVGVGLLLGVAVRLSAVAGALMLLMMWLAAFPIATHPFINYNLIHAVVVLALAFLVTHQRLSLAGPWQRITRGAAWLK